MPRRKRTTPQNEGQRKLRAADEKDVDTLVISDSEDEEEQDAGSKFSLRETRWRERDARAHVQDMTEEEMLDLAMQLSKQEASSAAQRQQLEDDDIQKAIAESLHVSHSQDFEENSESTSCMAKTSQDPSTVTARLRRKLCFPNKSDLDREQDEEVTTAAECGEDCMQDNRQLLPMPDMSQRTLSQPSPPSPALPSVPSSSSHGQQSLQEKDQDELVSNADSPEKEPSQCNSQTPCSPACLQQCAARMVKESVNTGRDSALLQTTQKSSLSITSPSRSHLIQQESQSPLKSPVFTKMDPKESTALSENDEDKNRDTVCTPKEDDNGETCKQSSSHKKQIESRDHQKRLSLCRKAQPSSYISVPDDGLKQEAVQPKQSKNCSSRRPSLNAVPEKVPNSEVMSFPADNNSLEGFTSHMVLQLSDNDDDDEEDEKIDAPSPVFHQECVPHIGHPRLSSTQPCYSPPTAKTTEVCSHTKDFESQNICTRRKFTSKTSHPAESYQDEVEVEKKPTCDSKSMQQLDKKRDGFVSYYWGVPFCPRGQNPDEYTTVILSQLEVYEKSLKKAQHQLLHKSEWGLPLFPCPAERPLNRRMKRHRAPQVLEEEEEPEKEEEQKKAEEEGEERVESQAISEEAGENGQNETYVVVSSPETQEDLGQKSPLLFRQHKTLDAVKPSSYRKFCPRGFSEDTHIQQPDEQNKIQVEKFDVESAICPETQMSEDNTPELMVTSPAQPQPREENEVMEIDEEVAEDEERMEQEQAEEEEEQQREPFSPQSQSVECPMCSRLFPINKIELHAAFCDGTTEEQEQQGEPSPVAALRKRNRRVEMEATLPKSENRLGQQEKCYLCLRFFSSKDYSDHVDKCLKQKRPKNNQGNGLISALHQAEQVHGTGDDDEAGPSDVLTKNHGGLAESSALAEAVGDGDCPESFCISSSPIKSFTPISEVTDCLIDFQQQYSDRLSRRLGRKRKFKR